MTVKMVDIEGCRSYATRENARRKLHSFLAASEETFRCLVIQNEAGRFVPAVLLSIGQQHHVMPIASNGILALGG